MTLLYIQTGGNTSIVMRLWTWARVMSTRVRQLNLFMPDYIWVLYNYRDYFLRAC
jgi:hypothetical protein